MLNWHWMNMYAMKNAGTAPTGAVVPTPAAPVGYPLPVGPLSFTTAAGTPFGPVPFVPPVARPALVEEEDEEDEEDDEYEDDGDDDDGGGGDDDDGDDDDEDDDDDGRR